MNMVMGELEDVITKVNEEAPLGSITRKQARSELKALQRVRQEGENVAVRDEAHMEEVSRNVQEAADSARAAAANWAAAEQDPADYAVAVEAGGRLPPQEAAVAMEEAAGSQAQAVAGCAPWESAEEKAGKLRIWGGYWRRTRRRM